MTDGHVTVSGRSSTLASRWAWPFPWYAGISISGIQIPGSISRRSTLPSYATARQRYRKRETVIRSGVIKSLIIDCVICLHSPANVIATSFAVAYAANVFLVKRYPEFFKNFIYVVRQVFAWLTSYSSADKMSGPALRLMQQRR